LIDVLAIGIALRAVLPGRARTATLTDPELATLAALRLQHESLSPLVERVAAVADALSTGHPELADARALVADLEADLLPHERADEDRLVPIVARALGSGEAVAALSRTHAEIEHQVGRLRRLVDSLGDGADAVGPEDVVELRRLLYGLYAVLRLHNAQEDEGAFSLVPAATH
jgi:hypothetical protein